jgi:Peptidase family M23
MTRPIHFAAVTLVVVVATFAAAAPAHAQWTWPVQGEVITQFRNGDDPYVSGQHRGIDIAADGGSPVVAATSGLVRFAGTVGSSGLVVGIRTEDGRFDTSYLHLSSIAVRAGQPVSAGERLGAVGVTGVRSAERPHLHFGVREAGSRHAYLDPLAFLPPSAAAPQRPPGEPAPSPVPAPLAPTPAPAPIQAPAGRRAPEPRRTPQPRGAPRRRPTPSPRSAPKPRAAPAPRVDPAPRAAPEPRAAPAPGPAPSPAPAPNPAPAPSSAPGPRRAPAAHRALARGPAAGRLTATSPAKAAGPHDDRSVRGPEPQPRPESGDGPDIGWVLACFGLLVAAGLLGMSEDGRRASAGTGRRVAAFLRPGLGRR